MTTRDHDPLRPHVHDPNPDPPPGGPEFVLAHPDGTAREIQPEDLRALPATTVPGCYIVSTGHGTSGPFAFTGVRLLDLVESELGDLPWSQVELISADGFGNRVMATELYHPDPAGPVLLAYSIDGAPMTRDDGLVRLIVPSEKDDALRQVKWVARVNVLNA
jgi:hypothetical protein